MTLDLIIALSLLGLVIVPILVRAGMKLRKRTFCAGGPQCMRCPVNSSGRNTCLNANCSDLTATCSDIVTADQPDGSSVVFVPLDNVTEQL